jgi:hypothetical protein
MGCSIQVEADGSAVTLRFGYDAALVEVVKRSGACRWRPADRCWWMNGKYWPEVRQRLLNEGVELQGPLAHPLRRRPGFGLFEEEQEWDEVECRWRWPGPWRKLRSR